MQTVGEIFRAETEVKRSRFLAYLVPIGAFEGLRERLREEHPKANHIVAAWRTIGEYGRIAEWSSDDGEPKGCAGVPLLNVLRGAELVECGFLVVRYFGGIRLGTGGMVRAYTTAAQAALASAELLPYERRTAFSFQCDYSDQRRVEYLLRECGIPEVRKLYGERGVHFTLESTEERLHSFRQLAEEWIVAEES
ncbi:IMPACT family protein [Nitratifractor sp.]